MRYEYKYYVPYSKINILRELIKSHMDMDPFAAERPGNQYTIRSIYFDSPKLKHYVEKVNTEGHRLKVRMRGYNLEHPDNTIFLELKKKGSCSVMKSKVPVHSPTFLKENNSFSSPATYSSVEILPLKLKTR